VKERIVRAFLIEEQKIVKKVRAASSVKMIRVGVWVTGLGKVGYGSWVSHVGHRAFPIYLAVVLPSRWVL
jgi:hypothetical protein